EAARQHERARPQEGRTGQTHADRRSGPPPARRGTARQALRHHPVLRPPRLVARAAVAGVESPVAPRHAARSPKTDRTGAIADLTERIGGPPRPIRKVGSRSDFTRRGDRRRRAQRTRRRCVSGTGRTAGPGSRARHLAGWGSGELPSLRRCRRPAFAVLLPGEPAARTDHRRPGTDRATAPQADLLL